jgi:phenylacetate-coenzyme A ligase PaaK-like adenylate-forming protein
MDPFQVKNIFEIPGRYSFLETALEIFNFQASSNIVYKDFIGRLGINTGSVRSLEQIPFMPVGFFKRHEIVSGNPLPGVVFESSGTTGVNTSRHHVSDTNLYEESFTRCFRLFLGDPSQYVIMALLPSYGQRATSSLVYMMNGLIKMSAYPGSGFFNNPGELVSGVAREKKGNRGVLLLGVSYALIDLAERFSPDFSGVTVIETGGMKGTRKEITRGELHAILREGLNINKIYSEYGMTELLSQAYSKGDEIFHTPPWMKVLIRDPRDPLSVINDFGETGGINVIDLANVNSCSFIATDDLGKLHDDGGFEVIGRFDNSDVRGCNLMFGHDGL